MHETITLHLGEEERKKTMVTKRKKLLSWITALALALSIFNVPLVGYANEDDGETSATEYFVSVQDPIEENNDTLIEGGSFTVENMYDDKFQGENGRYQRYYIQCSNEGGLSQGDRIFIGSENTDVAMIAQEGSGEKAASIEIPGNGTYTYFDVYYESPGQTDITVTRIPEGGTELEALVAFDLFLEGTPPEDEGDGTEPGDDYWGPYFEVKMVDPDDEEAFIEGLYSYNHQGMEMPDEGVSYEFHVLVEGSIYEGSADSLEWSLMKYEYDEATEESKEVEVSNDVAKILPVEGEAGKANVILKKPTKEGYYWEDMYVKASYYKDEQYHDATFFLSGEINNRYPLIELIYTVDGKEYTRDVSVDEDNENGTYWAYTGVPYSYDRGSESLKVTHGDKTVETFGFEWTKDEEDRDYARAAFSSKVDGEDRDYIVEIYVENASDDTACDIYFEPFDEEGNPWGRESVHINGEKAATEAGVTAKIPYGYAGANLYVDLGWMQKLTGFYGDGEEDQGYTVVSAGDTKEFTITAEDGTSRTYTINFVASEGKTVEMDMYANFTDLNLQGAGIGSDRTVQIEFAEKDGKMSAEVVLPYQYDNDTGIVLNYNKHEDFEMSLDQDFEPIYLGDDGTATKTFTATPPALEDPITYEINFRKQTEPEAEEIDFEKFYVEYTDENGEIQKINVDAEKAMSDDGAEIVIPAEAFPDYDDEFYVNLCARLAGYSYISASNDEWGYSEFDYNSMVVEVDAAYTPVREMTFDVTAANGNAASYKVRIINGRKAMNPEMEKITLSYITSDKHEVNEPLYLGEESEIETTIYPYDKNEPITVSGVYANGKKFSEKVAMDGNEGSVKLTSKALIGDAEKEYNITLNVPDLPIVLLGYEEDSYEGEDGIKYYTHEIWMDSNNAGATVIPYRHNDYPFDIRVLTMRDGAVSPEPLEIEWEEESSDVTDNRKGTIEFAIGEGEDKKTYTAYVIREGLSSDTSFALGLDCEGKEQNIYVSDDGEEAQEVTMVFPYGYEEGFLSVRPDGDTYIDDFRPGEWIDWNVNVADGEKTFTMTAPDKTEKVYTIKFVESDGLSTEVDVDTNFVRTGNDEVDSYGFDKKIKFEDFVEKNGKMVADVTLPYDYEESEGINISIDSLDDIGLNIDANEHFQPNFNILNSSASFEFEVTSAVGNKTKEYVINFTKQTDAQAKATNLKWVGVSYDGKEIRDFDADYIVDLSKVEDGNIDIELPASVNKKAVALRVYSDEYTDMANFDLNRGLYVAGLGDPGMFEEAYIVTEEFPVELSFDVVSSDGSESQTYNINIYIGAAEHDHIWNEGEVIESATCTEDGIKFFECTVDKCKATKEEPILAEGHDFKDGFYGKEEATCTDPGRKAYYQCNVCDKSYYDEKGEKPVEDEADLVIAATGHSMKSHAKIEPNCTEEGQKAYYECVNECNVGIGLFYDEAGKQPVEKEEDLVIEATNHSMKSHAKKEPNCTEEGQEAYYECENECNIGIGLFYDEAGKQPVERKDELIIDATGHDMKAHDKKEPNCTEEGQKAYYECENECNVGIGLFYDEEGENPVAKADDLVIIATGHILKRVEKKANTCTEGGVKAHYKCQDCGKLFEDKNGEKETNDEDLAIKADHTPKYKTSASQHWLACSVCHKNDLTEKEEHNVVEEGNKEYCGKCGYEKHIVEKTDKNNKKQQVTIESANDGNISEALSQQLEKVEGLAGNTIVDKVIEQFVANIIVHNDKHDLGFTAEEIKENKNSYQSFEVTLQIENEEGKMVAPTEEELKEGITITLPYDKKKNKGEIIVLHMKSDGTTEVLPHTVTDEGIQVTVTSLSPFMIAQFNKNLADATIAPIPDQIHTGKQIRPEITVTYEGQSLTEGKDYELGYGDNLNVGKGTVTITGTETGDYTGSQSIEFNIIEDSGSIENKEVTGINASYVYTGKAITPDVRIEGLELNKDYTVEFKNNVNAGKATVIVKGMGSYTGEKEITFSITPASIASKPVTGINASYAYTGKAIVPAVTISGLTLNKDYTVTCKNNVGIGTATVTIAGKGNYTGTISKTFKVVKANQIISGAATFNKAFGNKAFGLGAKAPGKLTYKTSNKKIATVSTTGKITIKNTGRVTITISAAATGTHNAAVKKVTINVAPKKVASVKAKAAKKKTTVSWKRDTKATGYQIVYSTDKKFKTGVKTVNIGKNKTVKKTISKLKSKKTYYVKVRAYKKAGSTKIYGAYSSVKKVKIK